MSATELPPLRELPCAAVLQAGVDGTLSSLQLETAAYAVQAMTRGNRSFFLGDATGVGKTRVAMAVLLDRAAAAAARGVPFRALWVSVRAGLECDVRDTMRLFDPSMSWQHVSGGGIHPQGRRKRKRDADQAEQAASVAFTTYGVLRHGITDSGDGRTLGTVIKWLRGDDLVGPTADQRLEAVMVLDEVHVAKNPKSTSYQAVCRLQAAAPCARVLYCTATAASDVVNLGYMRRLGLFDGPGAPFESHTECVRALRKSGLAALELVALHLKSRGVYVSRMLAAPSDGSSLHGAPIIVKMQPADLALYRECCARWAAGGSAEHGLGSSFKQDFFLQLLTAIKARALVPHVIEAVRDGWSVVVSLQSVGGSGEGGCRRLMQHAGVDDVGLDLPLDPLDTLILALHGAEGVGHVAEITGRKKRRERDALTGQIATTIRSPATVDGEVRAFQADLIRVAILSAAGGTGLSLHAAHATSPRRLHLLLQLPWSSESFVQQCGRTHRTGERVPPLYRTVVADVPTDLRVAQVVHQRLRHMGALTRGDRNSCNTSGPQTEGIDVSCGSSHMAGLETLLREAWERTHDGGGSMPRKQARETLLVGHGWNSVAIGRRAGAVLEERLQLLDAIEAEPGTAENRGRVLVRTDQLRLAAEAVRALLPNVRHMSLRWSPQTHGMMPARLRVRAEVLLRGAAQDSERGLGTLPRDILEMLIDVTLRDPWDLPASRVVAELRRAGISRAHLVHLPRETGLISRLAAVPVEEQRCYWSAVEAAVEAASVESSVEGARDAAGDGAMDLVHHCFPRGVPRGCEVRCVHAQHHGHPDTGQTMAPGHARFALEVWPRTDAAARADAALELGLIARSSSTDSWDVPAHLPLHPVVLRASGSNSGIRVVVASVGVGVAWDVEVWSAGSVEPCACLTEERWPKWAAENLRPLPATQRTEEALRHRWQQDSDVQAARRLARCKHSRSTVELVLASHALHEWHTTTGTLVRAEPPLVPWPVIGAPLAPTSHPW